MPRHNSCPNHNQASPMIKEIDYHGFSTSPSDRQVQDGALATSLNLLYEDGALRPVSRPNVQATIPDKAKVLLVHIVQNVRYIFLYKPQDNSSIILYCCPLDDIGDNEKWQTLGSFQGLPITWSIIGNIVAITFKGATFDESDGLCYFRWQQGQYLSLGTHPPFVPIEFGWINNRLIKNSSEECPVQATQLSYGNRWSLSWDSGNPVNHTAIQSIVCAALNSALATHHKNKRFTQSVLIRYGLKLYDGTYAYVTSPVLLPSATPEIKLGITRDADYIWRANATVNVSGAVPAFRVLSNSLINDAEFNYWDDIVQSIDIFVSSLLYDVNIGEIIGETNNGIVLSGDVGPELTVSVDFTPKLYDISDKVSNCGNFHRIASIPWDKCKPSDFTEVPIEDGFNPENIPTRPTLEEEGIFLRKSIPGTSFALNSRLNLADVESSVAPPLPLPVLSTLSFKPTADVLGSRYVLRPEWAAGLEEIQCTVLSVAAYCYKNGTLVSSRESNIATIAQSSDLTPKRRSLLFLDNGQLVIDLPPFIYHPETSSQWLLIKLNIDISEKILAGESLSIWIRLQPHNTLPGSYWIPSNFKDVIQGHKPATLNDIVIVTGNGDSNGPWRGRDDHFGGDSGESGDDNTGNPDIPDTPANPSLTPPDISGAVSSAIDGNKIMTSRANNPFVFPFISTTTVGDGLVRALAAPTQALSQGQFGQFPLYAFCTDGVWALETASDGSLSARQPVSRDVILPGTVPSQADHAVFFNTARGIMCLQGSQTSLISDTIDSNTPFEVTELPAMATLYGLIASSEAGSVKPSSDVSLLETPLHILPFSKFLENSKTVFDYTNQRLVIYNEVAPYAYLFSLSSRQWGLMVSDLSYSVNCYPDSWAVNKHNELVNLSDDCYDYTTGFYLSRPLKLDSQDIFKTIQTVIQRGEFDRKDVSTILYGSNDLRHWKLIWTSVDHYLRGFSGSPFKFYRLGGITRLSAGEFVNGASISFTPRLTNQLR